MSVLITTTSQHQVLELWESSGTLLESNLTFQTLQEVIQYTNTYLFEHLLRVNLCPQNYCTTLTNSLWLVTCDHHEEMSISSAAVRQRDRTKLSSEFPFLEGFWPQKPWKYYVTGFGRWCDPWQKDQLFTSKRLVTCDRRVGWNCTVRDVYISFCIFIHLILIKLL